MTRPHAMSQQEPTVRASYIEMVIKADDELSGMTLSYSIHGKRLAVRVSYDAPPEYDQRETSTPAQFLDRYDQAGSWTELRRKGFRKRREENNGIDSERGDGIGDPPYVP